MSATVEIRSDRLVLRPVGPQDCDRFVVLLNAWDVVKNLAGPPHPYTADAFAAFQTKQAQGFAEGTDLAFGIHESSAGLIGCLGVHRREDGAFEMGYWIGKPYWGQGFATEAGQALLAWFTTRHPEARLKASHFEDNPNSGRVLAKLGFTYTGERLNMNSAARGETVTSLAVIYAPNREERP